MVVGSMELALRLEGAHSLKEKRRILRSVIDRVRHEFQVAVAEVDDQDLWGNAVVGVACVSNNAQHADSILQHVLDAFDGAAELSVESVDRDVSQF
jgi:uncharacterized protein